MIQPVLFVIAVHTAVLFSFQRPDTGTTGFRYLPYSGIFAGGIVRCVTHFIVRTVIATLLYASLMRKEAAFSDTLLCVPQAILGI